VIVYSAVVYSCLCPWVFYWIKEKSIFVRRRDNSHYYKISQTGRIDCKPG
jgi:hypothetical protein